jgi:CubicO group peptidase (beta-lactamase class C family)
MIKNYAVIILLLLSIPAIAQEKPKDYSDAVKLIDVWLDAQKDYDNLPAIIASIVADQELIWSGAFGMANIEGNVKAKPKTLCSICSISKLFTSVAIMKLYDEGQLRLDDKIEDLLPWYNLKQQYSESGPITIRNLLSHSSGLPRENTFFHWNGPDYSFPTKDQIKGALSTQKTLYPASTYYQYSNLALTLLGYVVEEVSGESYDEYVKKNILLKLGLTDTRTTMPKSLHGNELAIGYSPLSREGKRKKVSFFQANGVDAAAGFSSNVEDLGIFAAWQFRLREAKTTEVLKPSTLKNMHNVHWTDPDWRTTRGLGFAVWKDPDGNKWVGHGGWCPGYKTTLQLNLKNKMAYSVMINAEGVLPGKYVKGLHGIMNKVKSVKEDSSNAKKKDLSEYEGYYDFEMAEFYVATWEGNIALVELPTDSPSKSMILFKHIEGDKFQRIRDDDKLGETIIFERDEEGKINRFKQHVNWIYTKVER